jgi:hypothetical protein
VPHWSSGALLSAQTKLTRHLRRYSKPEEYGVVEVPLPTLRENDVLVRELPTGLKLPRVQCLPQNRSRSRLVVSVERIFISMKVNSWPRYVGLAYLILQWVTFYTFHTSNFLYMFQLAFMRLWKELLANKYGLLVPFDPRYDFPLRRSFTRNRRTN